MPGRTAISTVAALVATLALASCGYASQRAGADAVLEDAADSLADRRSGRIDFSLEASADGVAPIGFSVEGPYSFDAGQQYAVLDLRYERVLGPNRVTSRIVSDGRAAWSVVGDKVAPLPPARLGTLRVNGASRGAAGLPDIDLAAWVVDGRVVRRGAETTVTGLPEAARILRDLSGLSGGEQGGFPALSDEEAKRLSRSVRAGRIMVTTRGDDHVLRSLHAVLQFRAEVPADLVEAVGDFAGAKIEISLAVADVPKNLRVVAPQGSEEPGPS